MILTCPACATRYLVDAAAIGADGRTVRCARCSHTWFERATPADVAAAYEAAASLESATAAKVEPVASEGGTNLPAIRASRPRRSFSGWLFFLAVAAIVLLGAYFGRHGIVNAWPPAKHLYRAVGIDIARQNSFGLELRNLIHLATLQETTPTLKVKGEVINVAGDERPVPPIRIALLGKADEELHAWTVNAKRERLAPGASTTFEAQLPDPPGGIVNMSVTFEPIDGAGRQ